MAPSNALYLPGSAALRCFQGGPAYQKGATLPSPLRRSLCSQCQAHMPLTILRGSVSPALPSLRLSNRLSAHSTNSSDCSNAVCSIDIYGAHHGKVTAELLRTLNPHRTIVNETPFPSTASSSSR